MSESDSFIPIDSDENNSPPSNNLPLQDIVSDRDYLLQEINFLENGDEEKFLTEYRSKSYTEYNRVELLCEAIRKKGSDNVVDAILSDVTDINYPIYGKSWLPSRPNLIKCVCKANKFDLFEKLLKYENSKLPPIVDIVKTLISNLEETLFNKWFDCMLDLKKFDINSVDEEGKTLLWHGLWEDNNTAVRKLLQKEAYIGAAIHFDNYFSFSKPLSLQDIEDCFDSCITSRIIITKRIIFNYRNLIPPSKQYPDTNEMDAIMLILNSKEHVQLLKHPLISSFMALKWQRMRKILYINLTLYCAYLISIVAYIIFVYEQFGSNSFFVNSTWWLTILGIGYLITREIIQLLRPKQYIQKKSNYLELFLIISSICTITRDIESVYWKEIVAVTILLMVVVFCNLIENFPIAFISTHMLMFQVVLKTFFKSFSLYSIFVFMFALSFYILFGVEQDEAFGNPAISFVKTMAMFIGELDIGSLKLKNDFFRNIVFLLFVICITIVLMNLLNGEAVRDIQDIRDEAELNGLISRAKFLKNHDYKLFPHHSTIEEESSGKEEYQFCSCKYSCIVEPEHLHLHKKVSLPFRCVFCFEEYQEWDRSRANARVKQSIWQRLLKVRNRQDVLSLGIEDPTIMEAATVKEALKIVINKEKLAKNEKHKLKNKNINNAQNSEANVHNNYMEIENMLQKGESIEHGTANINQKFENIKVEDIELNCHSFDIKCQKIEKRVENIERNVRNIEKEVHNIGRNVEKILSHFK